MTCNKYSQRQATTYNSVASAVIYRSPDVYSRVTEHLALIYVKIKSKNKHATAASPLKFGATAVLSTDSREI